MIFYFLLFFFLNTVMYFPPNNKLPISARDLTVYQWKKMGLAPSDTINIAICSLSILSMLKSTSIMENSKFLFDLYCCAGKFGFLFTNCIWCVRLINILEIVKCLQSRKYKTTILILELLGFFKWCRLLEWLCDLHQLYNLYNINHK